MTPRTLFAAASLLAGLLFGAAQANAGIVTYDISGGSQWRTTEDGALGNLWAIGAFQPTDGVAAWAPYGNSATTTLNENRMMWNCGADGSLCPGGGPGGLGPTEVFFGYSVFIQPGTTFSGAAAIIADDFFDLVINGIEVAAATLDGHKDASGQPVPLLLDLTPFLREGNNVIALRAMDGYLESPADCSARGAGFQSVTSNLGDFCKGDRQYEYMFISGSITVVPEPGALSLVGLGLLGLALTRRRVVRRVA